MSDAVASTHRTFLFSGAGTVSETTDDTPPPARGFLLYLFEPGCDEADVARLLPSLDEMQALMGGDDRPRSEQMGDGIAVVLHTAEADPDHHTITARVERLWLEKSRVIAIADRQASEVAAMTRFSGARRAPVSPGDLVARLALRAADRVEPIVDRLDEKLDSIEDFILETQAMPPRSRLAAVRRAAIVLRRHLLPQRDALSTLSIEDLGWLRDKDRNKLREAVAWTSRLYIEIEAISERAGLVHEQMVDARAEQMNKAMLVLAGLTAVFAPLTLISGLLGMNLAGIPFSDSPFAFWVVLLVLLFIAGLVIVWLRAKRWL